MIEKNRSGKTAARGWVVMVLCLALGALTAAQDSATAGGPANVIDPAPGLPIPSLREIIENIDLKCYRVRDVSPDIFLYLQHLNPVMIGRGWPDEFVYLQEAEQLCVPVAKNGRIPPPHVLRYIEWLDLTCYRIEGQPIDQPLLLTDLNPVLRQGGWGDIDVLVREPQQLCVPVAKDGAIPPPEALNLVQWIDLKTYGIYAHPIPPQRLTLTHLNPVLRQRQWRDEQVVVGAADQLMVPVAKDGWVPPDDVWSVVQFIDLKCHPIQDRPVDQVIRLTHLNPVLQAMGLPDRQVLVLDPVKLCVPVAKDGYFPE